MTYVASSTQADRESAVEALRGRLIEAEHEYRRTRADDYVARVIRDALIVEAHRAGMSSKEISGLVGDIGQPNVVRARRRAITRREVVPDGMLPPDEALEVSGLRPAEFMGAIREERIALAEAGSGVWAFRPEDVKALTG